MLQIERLEQAEAILAKIREEMEQDVFDDDWCELSQTAVCVQVEANRIMHFCNMNDKRQFELDDDDYGG